MYVIVTRARAHTHTPWPSVHGYVHPGPVTIVTDAPWPGGHGNVVHGPACSRALHYVVYHVRHGV